MKMVAIALQLDLMSVAAQLAQPEAAWESVCHYGLENPAA